MASESIPGFEDIAAPKTASKAVDMDAIKAAMDKIVAEKGTTTSVSVGKPGDTIKDMEQAQAEVDSATASASSASSATERAADADSLNAVGSSEYGVALTTYKNQLLDLQKKHPSPKWKGILETFDKIRNPEELEKHKVETAAYLRAPEVGSSNPPKKETAQGSNASGGTADSNKPSTSTAETTTPEKGKGFGMKGMAIGAGLAGVAGYMARGNSGGNSPNDEQLLDMVRGMNPQQLRQILQQLQQRGG